MSKRMSCFFGWRMSGTMSPPMTHEHPHFPKMTLVHVFWPEACQLKARLQGALSRVLRALGIRLVGRARNNAGLSLVGSGSLGWPPETRPAARCGAEGTPARCQKRRASHRRDTFDHLNRWSKATCPHGCQFFPRPLIFQKGRKTNRRVCAGAGAEVFGLAQPTNTLPVLMRVAASRLRLPYPKNMKLL